MTRTQFVGPAQDLGYLLSSTLVDLADAEQFAAQHNVLGRVNYATGSGGPRVSSTGHAELDIHMARESAGGFAEFWTTDGRVESGEHNGIVYAHDGEYFLCAGHIERAHEYADATEQAYITALDLTHMLDYSKCYRMWNFVNQINEANSDGLEIYRDFCLGRANAFEKFRFNDTAVPAATGIGSLGGGIGFYFLTSRNHQPTTIENPQQMAAYNYPRRYGPKAPKFARASYLSAYQDRAGHIYVSGTASITGHETRHEGDIVKQTHLALENIGRVIGATNLWNYDLGAGYFLGNLDNIKVYVRHADHIPVVRQICEQAFSPAAEVRYLNVDICRSDLLVEIEGIAN
jgi:chorismate lyase / 3-hydroxybenzoate synthase